MQDNNRELWWSFIAILAITLVYLFVVTITGGVPAARGLFGHSIGILGFILMLATETLYSIRKRQRIARWGKMATWLKFHIFTGLVGPYMVLLHTSWKFNGLAGVLTLFTVIIVVSGFIGRYIYTRVPRTVDGIEVEAGELNQQMAELETQLHGLEELKPETSRALAWRLSISPAGEAAGAGTAFNHIFEDLKLRSQWNKEKKQLSPESRVQVERFEKLVKQRQLLQRQVSSLANARRMLALWHTIHIPIGMAVFSAAFVHIIAAVYYATLLR